MIKYSEECFGRKPYRYAKEILSECQITEPPIATETIVDHLGLKLVEYSSTDFINFRPGDKDHEIIQHVPAFIKKDGYGSATIFFNKDLKKERQRLSVLHECDHAVLPWHQYLDYFCSEEDLSHAAKKQAEQEAFAFGTELLMPSKMFLQDICSLETELSAIEQIGKRYISSFEATAIRYARYHEGICAVLMVEQTSKLAEGAGSQIDSSPQLFQEFTESPRKNQANENGARLTIKYSSKSSRFPFFITPGKRIDKNNPIYETWNTGMRLSSEIPASAISRSASGCYRMEAVPLGRSGKVLVLLWSPDNQAKLF